MTFHVITLFPGIIRGALQDSILKKAQDKGLIRVEVYNLRDFAQGKHRITDDYPYGGGEGMVLKPEPLFAAVHHIWERTSDKPKVIYLTPQGTLLSQALAKDLAQHKSLILICGRYEGIDERVRLHLVDQEISIGDYVLTGGELAALVLIDVTSRLIPGVVGNENSVKRESFYDNLLDYPHYTRPREFKGMRVPEVLLSGDHKKIEQWRKQQALQRTLERRPDLIKDKDKPMKEEG
ncbi:MAG TPA: tRNA (guanosine(37)-N1)-methyltransferase TrmD [Candidatus Limnocylindrales bacterium]|nr:tRNA (guanosine(37)-N1)-methyltransferase TrmD [Candidatus Limnocylindrales bacterium]